MKFLSTIRLDRADGNSEELQAKLGAAMEFFKARASEGVVECAYASLEHPLTIYSIINAESHEAVLKMIGENPVASVSSICMKPLADISSAFAAGESQLKN